MTRGLIVAQKPKERRRCNPADLTGCDSPYRNNASRVTKGGGGTKNRAMTVNTYDALLATPLAGFLNYAGQDKKHGTRRVVSTREHSARRINANIRKCLKQRSELLDRLPIGTARLCSRWRVSPLRRHVASRIHARPPIDVAARAVKRT
jgi:hypothetical protein